MKTFLKILLIILAVIVISVGVIFGLYISWEKNFESSIGNENCISNIETNKANTDQKIKDFVMSYSKNAFITFSKEEVLSFLSTDVLNNINGVSVENLCVQTAQNTWKIYPKVKIGNIALPWFRLDVVKDNMETAELYVNKIAIAGLEIPDNISNTLEEKINKGISDAILMVNENGFGGRKIQNIELQKDKIIIKGVL